MDESKSEITKKKIYNNDNESPIQRNMFYHNSINANNLNNNSNDQFNRIRKEINKLNNFNEPDISNYSNTLVTETLKFQIFIYIIIVTIFSSLQFGVCVYIYIFYLYMKAMNTPINSILGNVQTNINNLNIPNISNKGLFFSFFLV